MSAPSALYKVARSASLFLSFAFGVVGLGSNTNAFAKSNSQKAAVLQVAPKGTSINIDDDDVFNSGAAVTAFCGALALASGVSLGLLFLSLFRSARSSKRSIATRTLSWQGGFLAVSTAGLFAALVAMTDFVANGEAKVSASVNGIAVPTVVVRGLQRALGVTTVYHEISYCKYCDAFLHMCFRPSPSRCSETRRYSTVDCAPFRDNLKYPLLRRCAKCLGR